MLMVIYSFSFAVGENGAGTTPDRPSYSRQLHIKFVTYIASPSVI
jgi:hypothetical protein